MVTDAIGDYLTRLRNAIHRGHKIVTMPSSKMLVEISKIMKEEGFIKDFAEEAGEKSFQKNLVITLRYVDGESAIQKIVRVSKPGVRRYVGYKGIPRVLNGLGITILTTPKGVMTGGSAEKQKVGGELLCKVW